jgi:hypothetical protein
MSAKALTPPLAGVPAGVENWPQGGGLRGWKTRQEKSTPRPPPAGERVRLGEGGARMWKAPQEKSTPRPPKSTPRPPPAGERGVLGGMWFQWINDLINLLTHERKSRDISPAGGGLRGWKPGKRSPPPDPRQRGRGECLGEWGFSGCGKPH